MGAKTWGDGKGNARLTFLAFNHRPTGMKPDGGVHVAVP
jgi:hypothetical protein